MPSEKDTDELVISQAADENAWEKPISVTRKKTLSLVVSQCEVDTGIPDLAEQHDNYLYGKPRKKPTNLI